MGQHWANLDGDQLMDVEDDKEDEAATDTLLGYGSEDDDDTDEIKVLKKGFESALRFGLIASTTRSKGSS